jgi:hypothetical protein
VLGAAYPRDGDLQHRRCAHVEIRPTFDSSLRDSCRGERASTSSIHRYVSPCRLVDKCATGRVCRGSSFKQTDRGVPLRKVASRPTLTSDTEKEQSQLDDVSRSLKRPRPVDQGSREKKAAQRRSRSAPPRAQRKRIFTLSRLLLKIHASNDVSRTPRIATRGDLMNRERKRRTAWRNGSKPVRPCRDDHVRRR